MSIPHLQGLIAAPPTPMTTAGELDLEAIERLYGMLQANGVRGAFVCGTTGESMSLTVDERMRVAARWCAVAEAGFAVIVHVGHNCLPDARALAGRAQEVGAHAVASMPPLFFKPTAVPELVAYCAAVAAAAPALPFYYYHMPAMTGVSIPVAEFLREVAPTMATLAGAKFTHEDLMDFGRCLVLEDGRYDMLFGRDEILLSALALGAEGAVGTTYNFAAPLYLRVLEAYHGGDMAEARQWQSRAREMVAVLNRNGGLSAVKPIMRMIGLDCGTPRLPLRSLTDQECRKLRAELDELGFFSHCCRPL